MFEGFLSIVLFDVFFPSRKYFLVFSEGSPLNLICLIIDSSHRRGCTIWAKRFRPVELLKKRITGWYANILDHIIVVKLEHINVGRGRERMSSRLCFGCDIGLLMLAPRKRLLHPYVNMSLFSVYTAVLPLANGFEYAWDCPRCLSVGDVQFGTCSISGGVGGLFVNSGDSLLVCGELGCILGSEGLLFCVSGRDMLHQLSGSLAGRQSMIILYIRCDLNVRAFDRGQRKKSTTHAYYVSLSA